MVMELTHICGTSTSAYIDILSGKFVAGPRCDYGFHLLFHVFGGDVDRCVHVKGTGAHYGA